MGGKKTDEEGFWQCIVFNNFQRFSLILVLFDATIHCHEQFFELFPEQNRNLMFETHFMNSKML